MALASGVNKSIRIKKEASFGVLPTNTGAQLIPRVTEDLNLLKNVYESQEITSSFQDADVRHGTRRVEGTINGEFHPGTYKDFWQSILRRDWTAGPTTGAVTTISATTGPNTFTRSGGSFLTDGFRVGMVVRGGGFTAPAAANNAKNARILNLTATVMTVDITLTAKAAGDTVTIAAPGKVSYVPLTGHTNDSYAIEAWHSDIGQSRRFLGCRMNTAQIDLPASGLAKIAFGVLGQDMATEAAEYFTTPTAAPSTGILAAVSGKVRLAGADMAILTGSQLSIAAGMQVLEVVGSNVSPDVFPGRFRLNGQLTAGIADFTLLDAFIHETEAELFQVLTLGSAANADFVSFYLPRIKFNGAAFDDGEKPLIQTLPIRALLGTGAAGYEATTLMVQDATL